MMSMKEEKATHFQELNPMNESQRMVNLNKDDSLFEKYKKAMEARLAKLEKKTKIKRKE